MRRGSGEEWRENQLAGGKVGEKSIIQPGQEGLLGGEGIGYLELCEWIECGHGRSGWGSGEVSEEVRSELGKDGSGWEKCVWMQ